MRSHIKEQWRSNGRAIGVLGTGVNVCYPKENKKLYEKVLGTRRDHQRVPARNSSGAREFPNSEPDCGRDAGREWWSSREPSTAGH